MNYEMTEMVSIYCFVSVSTISVWAFSMLFLPDDRILNVVNFMGIFFHFVYYFYYYRWIVCVCHMLYMICFIVVQYLYIIQIGLYAVYCIVVFHINMFWILAYTRSTDFFPAFFITTEILTRNIYITTYLLLSHSHTIFYFSGYIKTK